MARKFEHVVVFNDKPGSFKSNYLCIETFVVYYLMRHLQWTEFKYIMALLMTRNKYAPSNKLICTCTGLDQSKFTKIRKSLMEKGFIDYVPNTYVAVRYNYIRSLAYQEMPKLYGNKNVSEEELEEMYQELVEIGELGDGKTNEEEEFPSIDELQQAQSGKTFVF